MNAAARLPDRALVAMLALVAAWGLLTALDIGHRPEAGFVTDGRETVIRVQAGGGAQMAGLQAGDKILSIDGVNFSDAAGLASLGRPDIGGVRRMVIERGGSELSLLVSYGPLSPKRVRLAWLGLLPGFAFAGACAFAWLRHPSATSRLLAIAGMGCGLVFMTGPAVDHVLAGALLSVLRSGLVLAGFAAMLHFILSFPHRAKFLQSRERTVLLYMPAAFFWLLVSARVLFPGPWVARLDVLTWVVSGLVTAFYLLAGISTFLRRYIRMSREQRRAHGMPLILYGSLAGFVPAAVGFMPVLASVTGIEQLVAAMILPPLSWAWAVSRSARAVAAPRRRAAR